MGSIVLVVPCYNEASRLNVEVFTTFLDAHPNLRYLLVNDGSTDATEEILNALADQSDRIDALHLETNSGKAEAVRLGMIAAFEMGQDYAGYWDADLSTPLSELPHFGELLDATPDIEIVTGARIKMIGRNIERNPFRHYAGRGFATAVSVLFGLEMYDTQCGAKLFRNTPGITRLFNEPYHTKWVFDVELLVRYSRDNDVAKRLVEYPLSEWRDVGGSKMRPTDFLKAPAELLKIHFAYNTSS